MTRGRVLRRAAEADFHVAGLPARRPFDRLLMADPEHFEVAYAINPHMRDATGALQRVDPERARDEWSRLHGIFGDLGLEVDVVPPLPGHPDLVFCANQMLPLPQEQGGTALVASRMASTERAGEVRHVGAFAEELGYTVHPAPSHVLEGTGDGLWHPGRRLLWAGVGRRSSDAAWVELAERFGLTLALLPLRTEDFYHLDTCLSLLDEATCLWWPDALAPEGRALVEALIPRRIEAPPEEALERLACNAFCPDGLHVVIERGCRVTNARLEEAGYLPIEVDTGEFRKSGGSVFCMKLFLGPPR